MKNSNDTSWDRTSDLPNILTVRVISSSRGSSVSIVTVTGRAIRGLVSGGDRWCVSGVEPAFYAVGTGGSLARDEAAGPYS